MTYDNLGCRCTGRKPRLHAGVSTAWPPDGTGNESCTDSHDLILPVTYANKGCRRRGPDAIGVGGRHAIALTIGPPGPTSIRLANRTGYESCGDPHILILEPGSDIISPRYARRQT